MCRTEEGLNLLFFVRHFQKERLMKKGDMIELTIEDLGVDGEGIGKLDGMTFFVKEAKVMKMKKTYGYARLMKILEPSPDRVEPRCAHARQCGGCQLQTMNYEAQLRYKVNKVWNNLTRIGGLTGLPRPEILGMEDPWRYRNKAQFPFGTDKEGRPVTGFYAARSHRIIPCTECWLGVEENRIILEKILDHMETYKIPAYDEQTGKGLLRHVLLRKGFATPHPCSGCPDRFSAGSAGHGQHQYQCKSEKYKCDHGKRDDPCVGTGIYHRSDRRDPVSDLAPLLLPGKSGADPETL